jgi:hypothetical protein
MFRSEVVVMLLGHVAFCVLWLLFALVGPHLLPDLPPR